MFFHVFNYLNQVSYVLCQYRYFVCSIEYSEVLGRMTMDCEPSSLFQLQEYTLPSSLQVIWKIVSSFNGNFEYFEQKTIVCLFLQLTGKSSIMLYPFLLHSLSMSVFSSVIGPFGGFFASGFKRAFKIKVSTK